MTPADKKDPFKENTGLHLFVLALLSFSAFALCIHHGFLVYDDPQWITEYPAPHSFSAASIRLFFTTPTLNMYAPMVHLSFALDTRLGGSDPFIFHLANILLHVCNTLIVYLFVRKLSENKRTAFAVALLFAAHPVSADTVAWVSTRSNLLSTFFTLGALFFYLRFMIRFQWKFFVAALFLFILASLSKSSSIVLPFILLLIDHYKGRQVSARALFEKLPFFAVAVVIGMITMHFRNDAGVLHSAFHYSIIDKFFLLTYSVCSYLFHFFIPAGLSALYTYPAKVNGMLPILFYLSALIIPAIALLLIKIKNGRPVLFFGLCFFLITITINLVGFFEDGFMANRYAYLPYVGLMFIAADYLSLLSEKRKIIMPAFILVIGIFTALSVQRALTWKNDLTVFNDVISKQPQNAFAYNSRGVAFYTSNDLDAARADYTKAIELDSAYAEAYYNRAIIYDRNNAFVKALVDYSKAISLNPHSARSYLGRGIVQLEGMHDPVTAILDLDNAINLDPDFAQAYYYRARANLALNNNDAACADLNRVHDLGSDRADDLIKQFCK